MTDPWMTYEQEFIDELSNWPRPFPHRLINLWLTVDRAIVELLKGHNTYD